MTLAYLQTSHNSLLNMQKLKQRFFVWKVYNHICCSYPTNTNHLPALLLTSPQPPVSTVTD